jgi:hypothetical protein
LSWIGLRETVARGGHSLRSNTKPAGSASPELLNRHFKDTMSRDDGFDWSEIEYLVQRPYWSPKAAIADG